MSYILPKTLTEEALRSTGIQFGVKNYVTKDMREFVTQITANGNPIFDLSKILNRLETVGKMLSFYENPIIYATDARFSNALTSFSALTGIKAIQGRLIPGTLSNPTLPMYENADVIVITDPSNGFPKAGTTDRTLTGDRRAIQEAVFMGIPVVGVCNSNATFEGLDVVIPANNGGEKGIAATFYLLSRSILLAKGVLNSDADIATPLADFETKQIATEEESV